MAQKDVAFAIEFLRHAIEPIRDSKRETSKSEG